MTPIEAGTSENLWRSSPCSLDEVVIYLPNLSWGVVFGAVDDVYVGEIGIGF